MKIPKTIKVGAHIFTVELTKPKDTERNRTNWGKTMLEEKRILIDRELPESQLEETFLHEIMHICFHESRINYDIDEKVALTEEQIVSRLITPLHSILKNNKLLK